MNIKIKRILKKMNRIKSDAGNEFLELMNKENNSVTFGKEKTMKPIEFGIKKILFYDFFFFY